MAATIIAHQIGGDQNLIDMLAMTYIGLRVVYGFVYMANIGLLRTVIWTLGVLCTLGMFFTA